MMVSPLQKLKPSRYLFGKSTIFAGTVEQNISKLTITSNCFYPIKQTNPQDANGVCV